MNSNWNYPTTMWVGKDRIKDLSIACKTLNIKKVGHGGTLDPLATGVLPIAIGEATKVISFILITSTNFDNWELSCAIALSVPLTTNVTLDKFLSSVAATLRDSILYPRVENKPVILVSAPTSF